jgi:hypothetical protein
MSNSAGSISSPAPDPEVTRPPSEGEQAVREIGPYRLLRRIGEGGMGEVWLADGTRPVQRQVAVKVIKAGMDTAQVVGRFEAERQALAMMDHPALAKVFDGGTTPDGRPHFVMEYVRGEPITDYCDRMTLPIPERLDLFASLCDGVQHAHHKEVPARPRSSSAAERSPQPRFDPVPSAASGRGSEAGRRSAGRPAPRARPATQRHAADMGAVRRYPRGARTPGGRREGVPRHPHGNSRR